MTLVEGHLKLSLRIVHPRTKSQTCRFSNVSEISVPCWSLNIQIFVLGIFDYNMFVQAYSIITYTIIA